MEEVEEFHVPTRAEIRLYDLAISLGQGVGNRTSLAHDAEWPGSGIASAHDTSLLCRCQALSPGIAAAE